MEGAQTRAVTVPGHVHHVDDELKHVVVMNAQNGEIFGLDNSAAVMWRALADTGSEAGAVAAVKARYGIDQVRAEADVRGFVDSLLTAGLLVPGPAGA